MASVIESLGKLKPVITTKLLILAVVIVEEEIVVVAKVVVAEKEFSPVKVLLSARLA